MFRWFAGLRATIRSVMRRKRVEDELEQEFRYHIERQIQEERHNGLAPEEARYAAMQSMGPLSKSIEECRDVNRAIFIVQSISVNIIISATRNCIAHGMILYTRFRV